MLSAFELVEIDSIEYADNLCGIAYDFEVEEDHSYNVEGIIVHNSICSTRIQTGHGIPTLQTIIDCSSSVNLGEVSLIADGGIKTSGDIVKALAAGADAVMLGSLLSGTDETPGESIGLSTSVKRPGLYKKYRGMASIEAQVEWRGFSSSEEGVTAWVELKGPVAKIIDSLEKGIRSGLSYSGVHNINQLFAQSKYVKITSSGLYESKTHIHNI